MSEYKVEQLLFKSIGETKRGRKGKTLTKCPDEVAEWWFKKLHRDLNKCDDKTP